MSPNILTEYPYFTIALFALISNIPLGYIRENCPKFSFSWIFWIHASIPLIIYLRLSLGVSSAFIPVSIFLAIVGQIIGSRYRRKRMSLRDIESLAQIPDLNLRPANKGIDDQDIMIVLLNMGGPRTNETPEACREY